MKTKDKVITFIFCGIVICLYFIVNSYNNMDSINKVYNVEALRIMDFH